MAAPSAIPRLVISSCTKDIWLNTRLGLPFSLRGRLVGAQAVHVKAMFREIRITVAVAACLGGTPGYDRYFSGLTRHLF